MEEKLTTRPSQHDAQGNCQERWKLSFTHTGSGILAQPAFTHIISAGGTAYVTIDNRDVLTGQGEMSASMSSNGPWMSETSGTGRFKLTGKRDGRYLVVSMQMKPFPLRGTITFPWGEKEPFETLFEGYYLCGQVLALERKEGETKVEHAMQGFGNELKGTTLYVLSDGAYIEPLRQFATPLSTKEDNVWTLEYESNLTCEATVPIPVGKLGPPMGKLGQGSLVERGQVVFHLPKHNGPVKGEGPFKGSSDRQEHFEGRMILDGRVKDDILTFQPKCIVTKCKASCGTAWNGPVWFWCQDQDPEDVSLEIKNGSYHKVDISNEAGGMKTTGWVSWRLKTLDPGGILAVSPSNNLNSSGPDENDEFKPSEIVYTVTNKGRSPLFFNISKKEKWVSLSKDNGSLSPKESTTVRVTINEEARSLKEGVYKDRIDFVNLTNGKGNTSRSVVLDVGEEQTWLVKLTGQETVDYGGKLIRVMMNGKWKNITVDYGVRFDYALGAEFTVKKKKGKWIYVQEKSRITDASVRCSLNYDPTVFFIIRHKCLNSEKLGELVGSSLSGNVSGESVRLFWPLVRPVAEVESKIKLKHDSNSHKESSRNLFESAIFLETTHDHDLPLTDGVEKEIPKTMRSHKDQHRPDQKKQISIYYRYLIRRKK
jgi:hypothetical protein